MAKGLHLKFLPLKFSVLEAFGQIEHRDLSFISSFRNGMKIPILFQLFVTENQNKTFYSFLYTCSLEHFMKENQNWSSFSYSLVLWQNCHFQRKKNLSLHQSWLASSIIFPEASKEAPVFLRPTHFTTLPRRVATNLLVDHLPGFVFLTGW